VTKIEAIIQPNKVSEVREALEAAGVTGLTLSEVQGHGRQKGHSQVYRGNEYTVDLIPKVKIELVVPESRTEELIGVISAAAQTGKVGDGKIFISDVRETVRIRNGDRGDLAL
jgi:nitrogen regulatory protein P-II 1